LHGPTPRDSARRQHRRAAALATAITVVAGLATGCASPSAPAANPGARIEINTPQGVRAKQVTDMRNSDWPIGKVSVKTLAAPDMVDPIEATMESLWWDRPYTLTGVEIGAGSARLHLLSSFGAQQDIELRTNDQTMVSRMVSTTRKPTINSWGDIDAALSQTGARYSYQVSKVNDGVCEKVAGTNTAESLPLASIFKTYVLFAVEDAVLAGTLRWNDTLTITSEAKKLGSSGFDQLPPRASRSAKRRAR
jgi:hypothetical protein